MILSSLRDCAGTHSELTTVVVGLLPAVSPRLNEGLAKVMVGLRFWRAEPLTSASCCQHRQLSQPGCSFRVPAGTNENSPHTRFIGGSRGRHPEVPEESTATHHIDTPLPQSRQGRKIIAHRFICGSLGQHPVVPVGTEECPSTHRCA